MRLRQLIVLGGLSFLGAACAPRDDNAATSDSAAGLAAMTTSDVGPVREAIETANARFVDAAKRGDTTTMANNYTDDAIVMSPGTEAWRGREAIRKGLAGMIAQMPLKELSLKTQDVALSGDLAVETGTYEMTMQPKSGPEVKDKGKYLVAWKRQADGSWKIARDIFNSDVPPKT